MNHVLKHSQARRGARFVLACLAHHADDTGLSWPSVACLAQETDLAPRVVQTHLQTLASAGEIRIELHAGRTSNYRILTPQPPTIPASPPPTMLASPPPTIPASPGTTIELPMNCQKKVHAAGEGTFAEMPNEAEVAAFCAAFPGDLARGIPAKIPEVWWFAWRAFLLSREKQPAPGWNWREELVSRFKGDWIKGHPSARGQTLQKKPAPFAREMSTGAAPPML